MDGHNDNELKRLLASIRYSEAVKNSFIRSKQVFDKGVERECQIFEKQFAKFNAAFVQLEPSRKEVAFIPRNFTLYSLVQRQLLKDVLKKNRIGYNLYLQICLSCTDPWWGRKEPVSTLAKVFVTIAHAIFPNSPEESDNLEEKLFESIETALAFHPLEVEADKACLRKIFPTLPPLLLEDLFNFLMYYAFEDLLVYARGPSPDNDFLDIDNFFRQFYFDKDVLIPLPHAEWDPTRDYSGNGDANE